MSIAAEILEIALEKRVSVSIAESCTGGMLATALTDLPGSSALLDRGFVTYSDGAKQEMLAVKPDTLAQFGAVSEEVALEMAQGALSQSDADLALSITGIAGPGGSAFKPEGRVCFGWSTQNGHGCETQDFGARGRGAVRIAARDHGLTLLLRRMKTLP